MSLILVAGSLAAMYPVLDTATAWADDEDEDEDEDDDGGDEDEDEGGDDEEEGDEEDPDQPKVTDGGLFMRATYPISELERPLTITKGLIELRGGVGFDVSNETAFKSFGASLDARYGLQDHVELQGGLKGTYNFKGINAYAAMEAGISYNLVDFRVAAVVNRPGGLDMNNEPVAGDAGFSVDVGFPFRYAPKPQLAVIALDSLISFDIVADDLNSEGEKDGRPDAKPSIGVVLVPIPALAIKVQAEIQIPNFNFKTENLDIPASVDIQFSPNNRLDVGMNFSFPDLKPPEGVNFYDTRFLLFFAQYRLGDYKP